MTTTVLTTTAYREPVGVVGRIRDVAGRVHGWLRATGRHGAWIGVWSVIGWGGTLLAPLLIDHPFLLMLMAPRALFVALAADSVGLMGFVVLGTLRLGVTDASYFILGRRFRRTDRSPRGRFRLLMRWTDVMCRWLCKDRLRAGTVLFLRPNGKYLAVAGSYGVSPWVAGLSSVFGTALYLTSFHLGLGLLGF